MEAKVNFSGMAVHLNHQYIKPLFYYTVGLSARFEKIYFTVWENRAVMEIFFNFEKYPTFKSVFSVFSWTKTNSKLQFLYFVASALKS